MLGLNVKEGPFSIKLSRLAMLRWLRRSSKTRLEYLIGLGLDILKTLKPILKVETVEKTFCETALHIAAEENKVAIAELLLKHNPGCVDALKGRSERSSALHLAADFGYQETCRVLLAAGADVSLTNGQQMTAIHLAARNRSESVLRLLLTRSSNINTGLVNAQVAPIVLNHIDQSLICVGRMPTVEPLCLCARPAKALEPLTV